MQDEDLTKGQRINKWIRKYGGAGIGHIVDAGKGTGNLLTSFKDGVDEVGERVGKATVDTANLVAAEAVKLPGNIVDIGNEIYKVGSEVVTGKRSKENAVDKWNDRINATVNKVSKDNLLTNLTDNDISTARTTASLVTPGALLKGTKVLTAGPAVLKQAKGAGTKVDKLIDTAEQLIHKANASGKTKDIKKAEKAFEVAMDASAKAKTNVTTYVDKSKAALQKFIKKDKAVKKLGDEIKDITKRFNETKEKLSPEQIALMEKHLAAKQAELNKLISKGSSQIAQDMKKSLKLDKDIDKIVNPKAPMGKLKKGAIIGGATAAGGIAASEVLTKDDEADTEVIADGADVPLPEGVAASDNQTLDTAGEEKNTGTDIAPKDDGSTIQEEAEVTDVINNTASTSESVLQTGGTIMDRQGNSYPVFLQGGAYKIKGPDGKTYTLITGVNNKNKSEKYRIASNKALPF